MKHLLHNPVTAYETGRYIQGGVFGAVFALKSHKDLAIKQFRKPDFCDTDRIGSAVVEVAAIQLCNHPNIINIIDIVWNLDVIFIVMPLATMSLRDRLKQAQQSETHIPLQEAKWIGYQLVKAMHYLEQIDVAHGDLKPENILLFEEQNSITTTENTYKTYHLKLCDFGKAKIWWRRRNVQNDEEIQTLAYRSPETLFFKHFTYKSEVWAVGCILYELETTKGLVDHTLSYECEVGMRYCRLLGTPTKEVWGKLYAEFPSYVSYYQQEAEWPTMALNITPELFSLLSKVLIMHPNHRCSIQTVLEDTYFLDVKSDVTDTPQRPTLTTTLPEKTEESLYTCFNILQIFLDNSVDSNEAGVLHYAIILARVIHANPEYISLTNNNNQNKKSRDECLSIVCSHIAGLLYNSDQHIENLLSRAGYSYNDSYIVLKMTSVIIPMLNGCLSITTPYDIFRTSYKDNIDMIENYTIVLILLATISGSNISIDRITNLCYGFAQVIVCNKRKNDTGKDPTLLRDIISLLERTEISNMPVFTDYLKKYLGKETSVLLLIETCKNALKRW